MNTDKEAATKDRWQMELSCHDFEPFPALPLSVEEPLVDSVINHQFQWSCLAFSDDMTSAILSGAWALVAAQMTGSEIAVFDFLSTKNVPVVGARAASPPTTALPMHVRIAADQNVSEYVRAVQLQIVKENPLKENRLQQQEETCPIGHNACRFQTMIVIQPMQTTSGCNVSGEEEEYMRHMLNTHALTLELSLSDSDIVAKASFDSRVIGEWVVRRLLQRLEFLTQQLQTQSSEQRLADINIITQQDLSQLWKWNGTVPILVERCFHTMIEEIVERQPDAPAICAWDGNLTYSELDELATKLACKLIKSGIKQDTLVPLCFEKSMWTTIAILGVLKVGGAFVLLDPALPEQRLRTILQYTKANLILCGSSTHALSSRLFEKAITINTAFFAGLGDKKPYCLPQCRPSSLMYVTFTSGSTGSPKGVMITHDNVTSGLYHQLSLLGVTKCSRMLDFASYSFAAAISNLCIALGAGGCLCVPNEEDRINKLPDVIRSLQATMIDLAPSTAQLLTHHKIPTLKQITFGGEALHIRDIKPWWGSVRTINIYGQSECTSYSTINHNPSSPEKGVGIGKGAGLVTWIVDPENENHLLPIGFVGELLLEGPLVGRGYLDDPEKTAEAFIEDPTWLCQASSGQRGRRGRLYKTGDIVRYNEDGSLVYLGRKDAQVKIRGQRVELREVEHWVQNCLLHVSQVAAEVIQPIGSQSNPILAVFLQNSTISNGANGLDANGVRIAATPVDLESRLAEHLPSYMMPRVFFSMPKLPMTATGKLDRKQLRQIGASFSVEQLADMRMDRRAAKQKPTSEMEKGILKIWAHVLGIETDQIGIYDNFFHLGGDSIAAMKVVAEARERSMMLTVAHIFRQPILRDLSNHTANIIDEHPQELAPFDLLSENFNIHSFLEDISDEYGFDPAAVCDAYPCTPLQEGFMFLTSKRPGDYIMQSVLELSPNVRVKDLCKAWEYTVRTLPILRSRIIQQNFLSLLQVVLDERLQWIYATNLSDYLAADREKPMDLGQKLTRYALINDDTGAPRWLVWTIHHALYDGWSIPLIRDVLQRTYQGAATEPVIPFQSFIKYLKDQDNAKMSDYWKETFSGCEVTPFPTLPPSAKELMADTVRSYSLPYPKNRSLGTTPSILIRAAWALVVGHMTNSDDVVFGVTVSGRSAPVVGIEKMTGPTIATVPVRVQMRTDQTVSQYLESVQQQATEMIPFEHFGLQRISAVCPESQKACRFQNLLVIQPRDSSVSQPELGTWRDGNQERWFSTYALTLELWLDVNNITAIATFATKAIKPWLVDSLLGQLEHVITQLDLASSSQVLAEVEISTPQDLDKIWKWNHVVPAPVKLYIHEIIKNKAQIEPNAPAICAWDGELSYGTLDQLGSRLAIELVKLGVGPDVLVPLCFEKSMWTSVAILGVLKVGGGFVMLDPSLPDQRLQAILRQVKATLIISSPLHENLCKQHLKQIITLNWDFFTDLNGPSGPGSPEQLEAHTPSPSSVIYVTFTSGSTGKPKGVMITYINAASAVHYQAELMGVTETSRLYDFASYSFDGSISNMFTVLGAGGCLCVPSDEDRSNNLEQSIVSLRANALDLTPSVGQLLSLERIPEVRLVIFAGEALHSTDVERWWGKVRVCNAYGPSECSPTSTVNPYALSIDDTLSIGKGAGLVTWIVDPSNQDKLLAPGCIGELLLEGPLVGLGYLNDAEKTAAVFIEDPVWLVQGTPRYLGRRGRLYKTGDLVKYNEDGSIILIGRKDAQVKIRGQRVELGEIEHVLRGHDLVDEAVAILQEGDEERGDRQEPRIVSFVAIRGDDRYPGTLVNSSEESDFVEVWAEHFDAEAYTLIENTQVSKLGRDFIGWTSMYDGNDIDKEEMNEWLEDTIKTILNGQRPEHVLEIGSGSGMILFNLIEGLQSYVGLEPSARAVDFVTKASNMIPDLAGKVKMFKATAADLGQLGIAISPNLVIFNSVIQYFPSQDYLLGVVQDLLRVEGVKTIFFGDIRSYALYRHFLITKALHITGNNATKYEVGRIMDNLRQTESELLVDPAFFTSLISRFPDQIEHIEILPKAMRATNELSCYRYAAVIHMKCQNRQPQVQRLEIGREAWIDFMARELDQYTLLQLLRSQTTASSTVAISNIPHKKTIFERYALDSFDSQEAGADGHSNWLSAAHDAAQNCNSLSSIDLIGIGAKAGYKVEISWARQGSQKGGLDAIFHHHRPAVGGGRVRFQFPVDDGSQTLISYTSQPLHQKQKQKTEGQLYEMLKVELPSYMIPQTITVVDKMPINRNGKVDRRALLNLHKTRVTKQGPIRPPITNAERQVQAIWSRVLNIPPTSVGLDENFFELGGNSIAAMKVVAEARKVGLRFTVADVFGHPTLEDFVGLVRTSATIDLRAEISRHDNSIISAQQNKQILVNGSKTHNGLLSVLLTGANGFVGTQILRQLLEHKRVGRVIALVRGESTDKARYRTIEAAKKAQWWTEFHGDMLEVWRADLSAPHLGLDLKNWNEFTSSNSIDIVIHNGAAVHMMKSYRALEAANVNSTAELLSAVVAAPHMKFIYVSSARYQDPLDEQEAEVSRDLSDNATGYIQTKFVAESLVRRAALRSPNGWNQFAVVSPGLVIGTPTEGVANVDDWIWRLVAACIRAGVYNADDTDQWIAISDAATTAAAVIDTALNRTSSVLTSVKGGMTWGAFWAVLESMGYQLQPLSVKEWAATIRNDIEESQEGHPLWALADMLVTLAVESKDQWAESWRESGGSHVRLKIAVCKSAEFLAKVGFLPPPIARTGPVEAQLVVTDAFSRSLS